MSERKRILFLIHTLGGGGAEKALVNLVKILPLENYDITVQTVINTGKYRSELPSCVRYRTFLSLPGLSRPERTGESGSLLGTPGKMKIFAARMYVALWRLFPAKLLHRLVVHGKYDYEIAFLEGICAKIISGCPNSSSHKLAWIHVDISEQKKSHAVFSSLDEEREMWQRFDMVACVSEYVRDTFLKMFPSLGSKVAVCHNVLDAQEIRTLANYGTAAVEPRRFTFVSVGRLNMQKGYDRLINACICLFKQGLEFDVWIIGTGTMRDELQAKIREAGVENSVRLLGFIENPYPYVASADVFVAPSRTEGLSTVVAEALVLGKPVVATDCSGMSELLGASERGLIVDNSEQGIREGMREMLENTGTLERYRKAALTGCPFTAETARNEFEHLLGKV